MENGHGIQSINRDNLLSKSYKLDTYYNPHRSDSLTLCTYLIIDNALQLLLMDPTTQQS